MKRLLAVSIGGLGDTILFSPLLKALYKAYPAAHIELLVANDLAKIVYSNAKEVSHVRYVQLQHYFSILKGISIIPFIFETRINGKFDAGFFATGLNTKLARIMKSTGIVDNIVCAPSVPSFLTDFECNLELARSVDDSISQYDIFIPEKKEAISEIKKIFTEHKLSIKDKNIVAVYPSIELTYRPRWKLSNLVKIIKLIKNSGFSGKFVVVGSSREGEEWNTIDKESIVDANLAGKLSILGCAELLRICRLTLGNDGGLMHMAAAVGCPLVVIMANTPLSYKPPGENVKIIKSKLSCCNELYPNRPKDCSIPKCAEDVSIADVFNACQSIIKNYI